MEKISPSKYLIFSSLGFFGGIFIAELVGYSWQFLIIAIFLLLLVSLFFWRERQIRLLSISGILFLAGIFYYHSFIKFQKDELPNWFQKEVILQGQIISEPDIKEDKTKYTVQVYNIKEKNQKEFQEIKGRILISLRRYPEHSFGQWLEISGTLEEPKKYPDFNYKNYLSRFGISSVINNTEVKEITKSENISTSLISLKWLAFKKILFGIKNSFAAKLNQILPEPQSSFLSGLLLGAKKAIPQSLMDAFNKTGTTHIVVISGYNISIIIAAFMKLTRKWSKKIAVLLAFIGVFLFTIMVGAEAPVLRAAIMAIFIIWAERIGRKSDASIALVLTALIMILINPKILRFDLGFQLSFLAFLGLVWFSPILENLISRWRFHKFLPALFSEPLIATLSAQLFTIPIILYNFHRLSLIAPLANVLILLLIPLSMFLGFLAGVSAFIWIGIGKIIGWIVWLLLTYMILIVSWLSRFPLASLENLQISWIWLLVWYFLLIYFTYWYYKNKLKKKIV